MLSQILFKAGSTPNSTGLVLQPSSITLIVGPNNSGKSRFLVEIEKLINKESNNNVVIDDLKLEADIVNNLLANLDRYDSDPSKKFNNSPDYMNFNKFSPALNDIIKHSIYLPALRNEMQNPNSRTATSLGAFLSLFALRLDGKSRLNLINDAPAGDMQESASNNLALLFKDNIKRKLLREFVFAAFGKHLVIDPTNIGTFRLRLSDTPPENESIERGWAEKSVEFHGKAHLVSEASDGVKAFIGMLSTLIAGEPKVTLIDEPEAFLHPALAGKLGKDITRILTSDDARENQVIVSTHSASFIMGCIQGGADVNIIRLTYDYQQATARILKKEQLTPLMRNPLLRSVGVLNALFYNAVIVTEADADRAFYQEINERLLSNSDPRGISGCLFLNAQNKQTVWDIVKPLRELGIPAAGIVDIDVLKEGGVVWKKPLKGTFVPHVLHDSLENQRRSLYDKFKESGKDLKRDGGVNILNPADKEACQLLFDTLSQYGCFVVNVGEVESWLSTLNVTRGKDGWLKSIFFEMGDDPTQTNYLYPSEGDVWDFMGEIKRWMSSPMKKGIPA